MASPHHMYGIWVKNVKSYGGTDLGYWSPAYDDQDREIGPLLFHSPLNKDLLDRVELELENNDSVVEIRAIEIKDPE